MKDFGNTPLICDLSSNRDIMECVYTSNTVAKEYLKDNFDINTDNDHSNITFSFENTLINDDYCGYNISKTDLDKCNKASKLKQLHITVSDIPKKDVTKFITIIKENHTIDSEDKFSQFGLDMTKFDYTENGNIFVSIFINHATNNDNINNIVISYTLEQSE
jgi:hypothetical protein